VHAQNFSAAGESGLLRGEAKLFSKKPGFWDDRPELAYP